MTPSFGAQTVTYFVGHLQAMHKRQSLSVHFLYRVT